jgi:hypothetical protein
MNAFQLFKEDGTGAGIWACAQCGSLYGGVRDTTRSGPSIAEACCTPRKCDCGEPAERHRTACAACIAQHEAEREAERLAAAEKLDAWDGWVYWDAANHNDGYFNSLGQLLDWHEEQVADGETAPPLPEFVFVCRATPACTLDADDLIERATEDAFEDAADQVQGREELAAACAAFNEANAGLLSYTPDFKRAVRVSA